MLKIKNFVFIIGILAIYLFSPNISGINFDRILVVVDEEAITKLMFDLNVAQHLGTLQQMRATRPDVEDVKIYIAKKLLDDAVIISEAKNLGAQASIIEVDTEIENLKKRNQFNEDQFEDYLRISNYTKEQIRDAFSNQIKKFKILDSFVRSKIDMAEENVLGYYNTTYLQLQNRYTLNTASFMIDPENKLLFDKFLGILQQYYKNNLYNKNFMNDLYKDFKNDKSFQMQKIDALESELLQDFQKNLSGLKVGDLSAPFVSPFGVHIVEVLDMAENQKTDYNTIKTQVQEAYYKDSFKTIYQEYVTELFKKYNIDYRDQTFSDYIAQYNSDPAKYDQLSLDLF